MRPGVIVLKLSSLTQCFSILILCSSQSILRSLAHSQLLHRWELSKRKEQLVNCKVVTFAGSPLHPRD